MSLDPAMQGLVEGFAEESRELIEKATADILALEQATEPGPELAQPYERLARHLHTLKGSAATLGLDDVSRLAHQLEDVVAKPRERREPLPAALADTLLRSLDAFLERVRIHARGDPGPLPSLEGVVAEPSTAPRSSSGTDPALEDAGTGSTSSASDDDQSNWRVSMSQVVVLMREVERLRELRLRVDERRREVDDALASVNRLGVTGESAEARMLLLGSRRALRFDGEELGEIVDRFEEGVKAICTLPLRTILAPLHRSVRDLCRATGKEARLSVVGAEISLDRRVLEALNAPLVHLVRNAVDHGIEPPQERKKRGKHREGALFIRTEQHGNMVFIEVEDDGNGIDVERVREVARQRNLVSVEELDAMDEAQLKQLVFWSGFSTASQITETSGRGVGLDVVRTQVQALHGQIDVQSTKGQGTRFLLTLPGELGSSPVLVVRTGEHPLGIPLLSVESIVLAKPEQIRIAQSSMRFHHGDQMLPLDDLGARLGLRHAEPPHRGQPIVVIHSQGEPAALAVDEVIGDRDLVIRPLPAELRTLSAYQGATSMSRGELMPILRADWLVKGAGQKTAIGGGKRRALVVDDSLTARALHRSMLESGGYLVHTAGHARQALDQLQHNAYDLLVADITMPEMDGLELTREVRERLNLKTLPIILVSASEDAGQRADGASAGADAFISKKDCFTGRLLSEAEAVISRKRGNA